MMLIDEQQVKKLFFFTESISEKLVFVFFFSFYLIFFCSNWITAHIRTLTIYRYHVLYYHMLLQPETCLLAVTVSFMRQPLVTQLLINGRVFPVNRRRLEGRRPASSCRSWIPTLSTPSLWPPCIPPASAKTSPAKDEPVRVTCHRSSKTFKEYT